MIFDQIYKLYASRNPKGFRDVYFLAREINFQSAAGSDNLSQRTIASCCGLNVNFRNSSARSELLRIPLLFHKLILCHLSKYDIVKAVQIMAVQEAATGQFICEECEISSFHTRTQEADISGEGTPMG